MLRVSPLMALVLILMGVVGCCHHTEVTCHSVANPCEPEGIPYYLPKPLLVVSKNFRYIQDDGDGKSMGAAPIPGDKFDNQAQYADLKANVSTAAPSSTGSTNGSDAAAAAAAKGKQQTGAKSTPDAAVTNNGGVVPPGTFKDGVTPDTFYTYQVVFVPDMTQKYVMKLKGGAGEFRAAMNMVNGWMFTGLGPFYLKDSSTAQNIMAAGGAIALGGRGVADVVSSIADLKKAAVGGTAQDAPLAGDLADRMTDIKLMMDRNNLRLEPLVIPQYAEIRIYEASVVNGQMEWHPIVNESFNRTILGIVTGTSASGKGTKPAEQPQPGANPNPKPMDQQPTNPKPQPGAPSSGTPPPPKPEGTPQAGLAPQAGSPLTNSGAFWAPSAMENAIMNRHANLYASGGQPQAAPLGGQPQAAPLGGAPAAGGANQVIVNVNPPRQPLSRLLSCFKSRPHVEQHTIVGPEPGEALLAGEVSRGGPVQIDAPKPQPVTLTGSLMN